MANDPILVELHGASLASVLSRCVYEQLVADHVDLELRRHELVGEGSDGPGEHARAAADAVRGHGIAISTAAHSVVPPSSDRFGADRADAAVYRLLGGGTLFMEPIVVEQVARPIRWSAPIVVATYIDAWPASTELDVPAGSSARLRIRSADGEVREEPIAEFSSAGVLRAVRHSGESIASFARHCFGFALDRRTNLRFGTKDGILRIYDGGYREAFRRVFEAEFASRFAATGISYTFSAIDDAVSAAVANDGGYVWACADRDAALEWALVGQGFGSPMLAAGEFHAATGPSVVLAAAGGGRGTGLDPAGGDLRVLSVSAIPAIVLWVRALDRLATHSGGSRLSDFATRLEAALWSTVRSGVVTRDVRELMGSAGESVTTARFVDEVRERLVRGR